MWEFAPVWWKPKMTRKQVKKYILEMEEKRNKAKLELQKAELSWEFEIEKKELDALEKKLKDLF